MQDEYLVYYSKAWLTYLVDNNNLLVNITTDLYLHARVSMIANVFTRLTILIDRVFPTKW